MRRSGGIGVGIAAGLALAVVGACHESGSATQGEGDAMSESTNAGSESTAKTDAVSGGIAVLQVKDLGEIHIELLPDRAPKTVANFKNLASEGFYDNTTFHRVIPGFMIQGGDPNTKDRDPRNDGRGGPGYSIPDEHNETAHVRGVLSMANKGRPDTGGSQFFIVVKDAPHLDGKYTAFGRVIEGMEVADQIVTVERDVYGRHGPRDRPLEDVVLESVRIESVHKG